MRTCDELADLLDERIKYTTSPKFKEELREAVFRLREVFRGLTNS